MLHFRARPRLKISKSCQAQLRARLKPKGPGWIRAQNWDPCRALVTGALQLLSENSHMGERKYMWLKKAHKVK